MECTRYPIPIRADILTQLANVLAELYSDQAGARTTVIDTRLNLTRISYRPRVIDMWIELLKKADVQDRTKTVLTQAKKDKSTYKSLQ